MRATAGAIPSAAPVAAIHIDWIWCCQRAGAGIKQHRLVDRHFLGNEIKRIQ
jgi:hypothetical protein